MKIWLEWFSYFGWCAYPRTLCPFRPIWHDTLPHTGQPTRLLIVGLHLPCTILFTGDPGCVAIDVDSDAVDYSLLNAIPTGETHAVTHAPLVCLPHVKRALRVAQSSLSLSLSAVQTWALAASSRVQLLDVSRSFLDTRPTLGWTFGPFTPLCHFTVIGTRYVAVFYF